MENSSVDKLGRTYKLFVESADGTEIITIEPPLTLEFNIFRNTLSSTGESTFKIYNLGKTVRGKIYKDRFDYTSYRSIELKAGYGDTMPTIFRGNVTQAWSVREGTNFITNIDALDGGFDFINGEADLVFDKNLSVEGAIGALISKFPNLKKGAVGNFPGILSRGVSISGSIAGKLKDYTNGNLFVDLERVYCLNNDEAIQGSFLVMDSSTGLLGTPYREDTILSFDMVFEPRLILGQKIELDSISAENNFNGEYKVTSIKHTGMISDAVCGSVITSVGMLYGPGFKLVA